MTRKVYTYNKIGNFHFKDGKIVWKEHWKLMDAQVVWFCPPVNF